MRTIHRVVNRTPALIVSAPAVARSLHGVSTIDLDLIMRRAHRVVLVGRVGVDAFAPSNVKARLPELSVGARALLLQARVVTVVILLATSVSPCVTPAGVVTEMGAGPLGVAPVVEDGGDRIATERA